MGNSVKDEAVILAKALSLLEMYLGFKKMRQRKIIPVFQILTIGSATLTPSNAEAEQHKAQVSAITLSNAPLRTLPVLTDNGKMLDIAQHPGWRVIYFWSGECPCVAACENLTFLPLAKQYAGKVSFYAVVSGGYDLSRPAAETNREIAEHHLPYPVVLDPQHKVALSVFQNRR